MYKLLLVDDESDIREGLQEVIDFPKYGFTVVGEAANGIEALQIAEREEPDLIISDIRMPLMDGLTMLRRARQILPTVRCVILSGYDDFDYARQAISVNCLGYLLKPISSTEFIEMLNDARQKLDDDFDARRNTDHLRRMYAESLPLLREMMLSGLLSGGISAERASELSERYDVNLTAKQYILALADTRRRPDADNAVGEQELMDLAAIRIADERLNAHTRARVFHHQEHIALLLLSDIEAESAFEDAVQWLDEARKTIDYYLGAQTMVGISLPCARLENLPEAARQALSALEQCTLWENQLLLCAGDLEPGARGGLSVNETVVRALCTALKQNNKSDAQSSLCRLMSVCTESKPARSAYRAFLLELYISLLHTARDTSVDLGSDATLSLERLVSCPPPEEARQILWALCEKCSDGIVENRATSGRAIARSAGEYIAEHYADSKLTIEKLCSCLHVSPSYFSALYKKETQQTFLQRLTEVRMEKAMNLIVSSEMKTAQVAEAVGIPDPSYFSYAFKRYFGVSPSQARKRKEHQP